MDLNFQLNPQKKPGLKMWGWGQREGGQNPIPCMLAESKARIFVLATERGTGEREKKGKQTRALGVFRGIHCSSHWFRCKVGGRRKLN